MMRTKKPIVNQFRANESFVSSLGSLTSTIKKGRYKVLNNSGQYETIHLETSVDQVIENSNKQFVSEIQKDRWNNKADKNGSTSQDFSAKILNVSNSILPTQNGIDIGSPEKRFRGIYVDEAYLSTNTLYIGDTPILGTNNDTITIKADPNQSITMQTRARGTTKVISEAGVELSTSGMNADVVLQATGTNAQVKIGSTGSTHIDAANVKITGDTVFKNSIAVEKDLTISGNLTVEGSNTTLRTSNLIIKDNIIEINNGQTGNSVSDGKAGIKINRGDADAFNILFHEADNCLKVGTDSSLKAVALQEWVEANTAKRNHTHDYLSLTGGNLTGELTVNKHKVYHAGNKPSLEELGAAKSDHTHTSGNITALHGYTKLNSTSDIVASDSLNTALGKLEKGLEGKKDISWVPNWSEIIDAPTTFPPVSHNHSSKEVLKMTGYKKGTTTSAIIEADSLNLAISKLEVALDGKASTSHGNHIPASQNANSRVFLRNDNTWQSLPTATTSATGIVQLNDSTDSTSMTQAATANAVKKVYDLANGKASSSHSHNNLSSRGRVTMETNTNRPAASGLSMSEVYHNNYPISYGNVMSMKGSGDSQLLIGWSGTSGAHAPAYIRSRRDQGDANWSDWAQIYTTAHKPSLTDLGISTLTRGSYLTGENYNGTGATIWAVDATTTATANKVVARDGNADVFARLFKSNYANENTISGAIAFRVNNSDNNSIKFCSDTGAIRTFLNIYAKNEMDSRYRQKTDLVFEDTISIKTPAA